MQLNLFSEVYYDIETQHSADEVGGWNNIHLMRIAAAVTWSSRDGFRHWDESHAAALLSYLTSFETIISFNGDGFDSRVLSFYGSVEFLNSKSFDLLTKIKNLLGHRLTLDSIAQATLNMGKSADGLQSLKWWKEGKIDLIKDYCQRDVQVLVDLVAHARSHGNISYVDKSGKKSTISVRW